jgi:hypothetical protein
MPAYISRFNISFLELGSNQKIAETFGGPDRTKAGAMLTAVAAATVGKFCTETYSEKILIGPTFHAAGYYSDVELDLAKAGTGDDDLPAECSTDNVTLRLQNITTDVSLKDANGEPINGIIDPANPLIAAIAAAYYNTQGANGYVALGGRFVR